MAAMPKPDETVPLVLRYDGPDVDDGSMSIEDVVPVLQGFAGAYGKIAAEAGVGGQHRIRITGVQPGSAKLILEVWDALGKMADPLTSISLLTAGAASIVGTIVGVIKLKRHLKGKPFKERITGEGTVSVTNIENVTINMPINIYNIYKSKLIDQDLAKIVRPLKPGQINSAEISAQQPDGSFIQERISATERELFETEIVTVTTTKTTWLVGQLTSLNKPTESGYLILTDGTRVFYHYAGENVGKLHSIFGTYEGPVKVFATANMDENLKVVQLEILDIEKMQGELFPAEETAEERQKAKPEGLA
jgi:hypothetical protein